MATYTKRKNKDGTLSTIAQVRLRGAPCMTRAFPTKTAATIWAEGMEKQIRAGSSGSVAERMTFGQLLDEVEPRLVKSKYAAAIAYWREQFGTMRIRDITPDLIDMHRDALLGAPCASFKHKTKRARSKTTTWHYLQQLSRIFTVAIKDLHRLTDNPLERVTRPSLTGTARIRYLDDDEILALLNACKASDSKSLYALVLLLLTSGCRRGEALALEWKHIDVERRAAFIPKTKTGVPREIPLAQQTLDALMALPRGESGLVFESYNVAKAFNTALKRAEITGFRMHDLRHSAATLLRRAGNSLPDIGALLGHADVRSTNRYAHVTQKKTAAMVDAVMGNIGKTK
jgi:integrase